MAAYEGSTGYEQWLFDYGYKQLKLDSNDKQYDFCQVYEKEDDKYKYLYNGQFIDGQRDGMGRLIEESKDEYTRKVRYY